VHSVFANALYCYENRQKGCALQKPGVSESSLLHILIQLVNVILYSDKSTVKRQPTDLHKHKTIPTAIPEFAQPTTLKADSHIACRARAAPMPFPCHAVPLRV